MSAELLPNAEALEKYAENEIQQEVVAKFNLENITHARLGGYNTRVTSPGIGFNETIRTTSIKGVWRWWLRAALAGAYCDAGQSKDWDHVAETANETLGSIDRQSRFSLKFGVGKSGPPESFSLHNGELPVRLKLLTQGVNDLEKDSVLTVYPPGSLKFNISILKRKNPKNSSVLEQSERQVAINKVAVGSLCIALLLGGLGSMTRRGFGHFRLDMSFVSEDVKVLNDRLRALYLNPSKENLESLRNFIAQAAIQALGLVPGPSSKDAIPSFPSLCKNHFRAEIVSVKIPSSKDQDYSQKFLLAKIGNAVLKNTWKINDPNNSAKSRKALQFVKGKQYETWVLGLPRHVYIDESRQGGSKKFPTGYLGTKKEEFRRASAISIAPFSKNPNGNYRAVVYGFRSTDWPDIEHYSYRKVPPYSTRKDVIPSRVFKDGRKTDEISKAFDLAFRRIHQYLEGNQF